MNKFSIGYFADGPWSHQALEKIISDDQLLVSFICARYDNPDNYLKEMAERYRIPFFLTQNINSQEFIEIISQFKSDLLVSMSFNQIFKGQILRTAKRGIINCHAGLLPFYRGRNILNWALINDEKEFGITVHYVDEGIDTGDIISQSLYPISDQDDYQSLLIKAYGGCANDLYAAISKIRMGFVKTISQSSIHKNGFYCVARKAGDEIIDWSQSSRDIFNFVRAICKPGPQARTYFNSNEIRINKAHYLGDLAPSF